MEVGNCVKFYQVAEDIKAETLQEQCLQLISSRWEDFSSEDFAEMSASLLYKMLLSRSEFPLHSAVRLKREDVVFLYLVEFDNEVRTFFMLPFCKMSFL